MRWYVCLYNALPELKYWQTQKRTPQERTHSVCAELMSSQLAHRPTAKQVATVLKSIQIHKVEEKNEPGGEVPMLLVERAVSDCSQQLKAEARREKWAATRAAAAGRRVKDKWALKAWGVETVSMANLPNTWASPWIARRPEAAAAAV